MVIPVYEERLTGGEMELAFGVRDNTKDGHCGNHEPRWGKLAQGTSLSTCQFLGNRQVYGQKPDGTSYISREINHRYEIISDEDHPMISGNGKEPLKFTCNCRRKRWRERTLN